MNNFHTAWVGQRPLILPGLRFEETDKLKAGFRTKHGLYKQIKNSCTIVHVVLEVKKPLKMLIFLRNIPSATHKSEITKHVESALKSGLPSFFKKKYKILSVEIIHIVDKDTRADEYHGLVRIEPDSAARRVIKKLNRKPFKNKPIAVREYHVRSWHNDKRVTAVNQFSPGNEKRKSDRRRKNLEITKTIKAPKITGLEGFNRKLN